MMLKYKRIISILNGNKTETQAKTQRHNAYLFRLKRKAIKRLRKMETLRSRGTPLDRQTEKIYKTISLIE